MSQFTYHITCDGKSWYTGRTNNLTRRVTEHQRNGLFKNTRFCRVNVWKHKTKPAAKTHEQKLVCTKNPLKNKKLKKGCRR